MDFLNGRPKVEIFGQPKTVRMRGRWRLANGELVDIEAPTECWIAAIVNTFTEEQKAVFITQLKRIMQQREHQLGAAQVVASIEMPNVGAKL